MYTNIKERQIELDIEWIDLISEAKSLGLTIEEVQLFLTEFGENTISKRV